MIQHVSAQFINPVVKHGFDDIRRVFMCADMLKLAFGDEQSPSLLPVRNLSDAAPRVFVKRNVEALYELRMCIFYKIRQIFRRMLARLRDIIAKFMHHFVTDAVIIRRALLQRASFDFRIQIYSVFRHLKEPGLVVDAGNFILHGFVIFHTELAHQAGDACLHAVAEPYGFYGGNALDRARNHGHGVCVVDKQSVRADGLHIVYEIQHDGNRTQGAENAADAERICNRLTKSIFFGDFKIGNSTWLVSADLYRVHDKISASQRFLPVGRTEIGFNFRLACIFPVDCLQHDLRICKAFAVNVVQGDFQSLQIGRYETVAQHIFCEHGASRAHKSNFQHSGDPPLFMMQLC